MRATSTARLVLAALGLFTAAVPVSAQTQIGGLDVEGDVEAGWRFFYDEPAKSRRAKWEEYRDYPGSAFLGELQLRIFKPDESYSLELQGSKWGQQDQEFAATAERLGLWQLGFSWDQTPHVLSTDAQLLATQPLRGIFALPDPRPALPTYNSAPTLDEISVRWDTARIFFTFSPAPDLEIKSEYTRTHKSGDRPFGMAFGSPGSNFYEILQPIEQTIHDFRLRGTWAKERWQLQFGYALSIFQNDLDRVKADNPCFGLPAAVTAGGCGSDANGAPQSGQSSLPPNNMANTFTLSGGVNLPMRTRLTGNLSYSVVLQNQDFLPVTINQNLLAANSNLALPQSSLNGNVQTVLLNLGITSRPLRPLTLSAKYRFFDLSDNSDEITFAASVLDDRTLAEGRRAGRYDYQRQNADVDARWQLAQQVALTVGGGWERWSRNEQREVPDSDEAYAKVALDVVPTDWLFGRLTYRPSVRRISSYNTRAHAEHTVVEEPAPTSQGQSVLLRKFDENNRNVQQVDLYLQFTPLDKLSITPSGSYKWTQYPLDDPVDPAGGRSNFLGVQNLTSWNAGVDLNWSPWERVSLYAGYMYESDYEKMESRYRPVVEGEARDLSSFDWISNITDTNNTAYAGFKATLLPKVLDWSFNGSYAYALGTVDTRNPAAPTGSTAANDFTARAKRMPAFDNELIRLETALAYHFLKVWTAKLGYVFESYTKHDWRTDGLNPFLPAAGASVWLGNDVRNYTAHTIAASVGFKFK